MNILYAPVTPKEIFFLLEQGFMLLETTQEYQVARYKKNSIRVTLYTSGKLHIQCPDEQESVIRKLFAAFTEKPSKEKKKIAVPSKDYNVVSVFGSDETLKGDTFGGLIVTGFSYEPHLKDELLELGVKDSKLLTADQIERIAKVLLAKYPQRCISIELSPEMYNKQTSEKNITQLLNELHAAVGSHKLSGQLQLVDAYPGCTVGDDAITQAESHSLAVAAASIVARSLALAQFERLSNSAGFSLPKGSTHVLVALNKLILGKKDITLFAKLHFKNVQKALKQVKDNSKL